MEGEEEQRVSSKFSPLHQLLLPLEDYAEFGGEIHVQVEGGYDVGDIFNEEEGSVGAVGAIEGNFLLGYLSAVDGDKFKSGWEDVKKKVGVMNDKTGCKTVGHALWNNEIYGLQLESSSRVADNADGLERDHDHRYAVIWTETAAPDCHPGMNSDKAEFIKKRYKREKVLIACLRALFSKVKVLEDSGAKVYLEVTYEKHTFNSSNYENAETLLSKTRRGLLRVPVVSSENETLHNPNFVMRIERQRGEGITPGVHLQYIQTPESSTNDLEVSDAFALDHSYVSFSSLKDSSHRYQNVNPCSSTTPSVTNASTNTQTTCAVCGPKEISGEAWIRCFNPLCHYTAHPSCIGFIINSPIQLALLPPFLCPIHR